VKANEKRGDTLSRTELDAMRLIKRAVYVDASDIHIMPKANQSLIKFRVHSIIYAQETISLQLSRKLISYFKFTAGMNIGEKRLPQSGSLEVKVDEEIYHLRLSTLPTRKEESLVIRVHPQFIKWPINKLALFRSSMEQILALIKKPSGCIVFCGPTGSGKTTLMYSLLHELIGKTEKQIITIEDPIEYHNDCFTQLEVNEVAGLTYSVVLKSMLRHNPDIIMVGEIRDAETANMVMHASLTGHLVLTTMHANDPISCIQRFDDLGVSRVNLTQSLTAIVSQRLVNIKCPFCIENCSPYCQTYRNNNRSGIYDILSGHDLIDELSDVKRNFTKRKGLINELVKGIALGYLPEKMYDLLLGEGNEI
jgi:competence protein ComGA